MPLASTILVVEDNHSQNATYCNALQAKGYVVTSAFDVVQAFELINDQQFDVVVVDMLLPMEIDDRLDFGGVEIVHRAKSRDAASQVIAITGHGSRELAVQATAAGAIDYIIKDIDTTDRLMHSVRVAIHTARELRAELQEDTSNEDLITLSLPAHLIANSPAMRLLLRQVQNLAENDATVLITGEPGVGKELIASVLHANSSYASSGPYRVAMCRNLSAGLAELYGGNGGTSGLVSDAEGGTLVLRRVDLLPFNMQKLLVPLIEHKQYQPIGATQAQTCFARIIVTAAGNLPQMVQRGRFWRPLYDQLSRYTVHVPPLRERSQEDLAALAGYMLHAYEFAAGLTKPAIQQLVSYSFARDNIRELEQILRDAALQTDDDIIDIHHLPPLNLPSRTDLHSQTDRNAPSPINVLTPDQQEETEHYRKLIRAYLQRMRQREIQQAALGIQADPSITTEIIDLQAKIKELELAIARISAGDTS